MKEQEDMESYEVWERKTKGVGRVGRRGLFLPGKEQLGSG